MLKAYLQDLWKGCLLAAVFFVIGLAVAVATGQETPASRATPQPQCVKVLSIDKGPMNSLGSGAYIGPALWSPAGTSHRTASPTSQSSLCSRRP